MVSGDGNEKLLSVPTLAAGTGEQEAVAVYNQLKLWRLSEKVLVMSFDTCNCWEHWSSEKSVHVT